MESISCLGRTIGHIASPHPGIIEMELSGQGHPSLVALPRTKNIKGRGSVFILRNSRLKGLGTPPPVEVMALRKYLSDGLITICANGHSGAVLAVRMQTLDEEKVEGEIYCRFAQDGVSLLLPDGRWILGQPRDDEKKSAATESMDTISSEGPPWNRDEAEEHPQFDDSPLELLFNERKEQTLKDLDRFIKKQTTLIKNIQNDLVEFSNHQSITRMGDLVKAQLWRVRRGMEYVEVEDWFSVGDDGVAPSLRLPLDPVKDPAANLEAIYAKAGRFRRGLVSAARRLDEVKANLRLLEDQRSACAAIEYPDFVGLAAYEKQKKQKKSAKIGFGKPSTGRQVRALPWRTFPKENVVILAGKTAASNAQLSLKVASGNDLWFHSKNWPGSHVLLRRRSKKHVFTEDEIYMAAVIALYYSEAKKFGKEEVMLTEAKHVRRIPGAPVGTVSAAASRSILVTLDDETVRKALANEK